MNTVKCPRCNLTNWVSKSCKRCSYVFGPNDTNRSVPTTQGFANVNQDPYQNRNTAQGFAQSVNPKSGLAIASMVIGICAFVLSIVLIGLVLAPVGLILGIIALVQAKKKPLIYGGQGYAIAGVIISAMVVMLIPIVAVVAIPNLMAAKKAADEGSAISSLRTLYSAQKTHVEISGSGSCGELRELGNSGLIDSVLASGKKNNFRFEVKVGGVGRGCEMFATPINGSPAAKSFMVDVDGVIRAARKNGAKAEKYDPPLSR